MSFRTKLFEFSKKRNSTARPDITQPGYYEGDIKEDFSPLSFTMTFDRGLVNASVPTYNYAYIADFSRYYYVTDWVFVKGLWRAAFTVDVLATYKSEILQSTQYVTRSKAGYGDISSGGIIDTTVVTNGGTDRYSSDNIISPVDFWGVGYTSGTIVIGVIGNSGLNVGSVTYYALSVDGYQSLTNSLLNNISWAGISVSEISEELQKALINPLQYIVSAVWLPVHDETFIGSWGAPASDVVSTIKLGWWSFPLNGYVARILHNPLTSWDSINITRYFPIVKHPQSMLPSTAHVKRPWLNLSPYSRYTLTLLPFGSFDLDTSDLYYGKYLKVNILIHSYTGDSTLTLSVQDVNTETEDSHIISIMNANCGVPLPIGQIALNMGNIDSALTSAAIMGVTEVAKDISAPSVVSGSYEVKTKSKPSAHSTTTHRSG